MLLSQTCQRLYGTHLPLHGVVHLPIALMAVTLFWTTTASFTWLYTVTDALVLVDLLVLRNSLIKSPNLPTSPDAVVIVATLRVLKMNGGVAKDALTEENVEVVRAGFANLKRHTLKISVSSIPAVVAINEFVSDTEAEIAVS